MTRALLVGLGLVLAAGFFGGSALAGNPNRQPLTLISTDYGDNHDTNTFPDSPPGYLNGIIGCQDEDDKDRRWYSGWLAAGESFTTSVRFCHPAIDGYVQPWDGQWAGFSDGNTGAWFEIVADTHLRIDWTLIQPDRTVTLHPTLLVQKNSGRGHEEWKGCEATVPGTVTLTVTNMGRGSSAVLGFGSRWHDTFGTFFYDCP